MTLHYKTKITFLAYLTYWVFIGGRRREAVIP
jgi:hypothetical protein